jgi:hypothetical protein
MQNIWPARSYSLHANAYVTKPTDFDRFMNTIGQIDDFYLTLVKPPGLVNQRTALDHGQLSWRKVAMSSHVSWAARAISFQA